MDIQSPPDHRLYSGREPASIKAALGMLDTWERSQDWEWHLLDVKWEAYWEFRAWMEEVLTFAQDPDRDDA